MKAPAITEPIHVKPRLDPKPWGGHRLAAFGVPEAANLPIGEAVMTANDVLVAGGRFDGQSLGSLIMGDPDGLLGNAGVARAGSPPQFPLLIKLIDAEQQLSIQVHPDNAMAPAGSMGKSEAWYVLAADPGARVYAGLEQGVSIGDVRTAIDSGHAFEALVRPHTVTAGDVLYLPAGTIHALGGGIVVYEIQQPSTITYRLHDWGRDREMHYVAGLAVLAEGSRPTPQRPPVGRPNARSAPAVQAEHFALEILELGPGDSFEIESTDGPQTFTCIGGELNLKSAGGEIDLAVGGTGVLFANAGPVQMTSRLGARVLRGSLD